jgi:hypothetical protein
LCWPARPRAHSALSPAYGFRLWSIYTQTQQARERGAEAAAASAAASASASSNADCSADEEAERLVVALRRAYAAATAVVAFAEGALVR